MSMLACAYADHGQPTPLNLEVISTIPNKIPLGSALPITGVALQLAAEDVADTFRGDLNLTVTLLYNDPDRHSVVTNRMYNPKNTPTSVGMASSYEDLVSATLRLFRILAWSNITLLKEESTTNEFYWQFFAAAMSLSALPIYSDFSFDGISLTPSDRQSVNDALTFANRRSRVWILLGNTAVAIKLLRIAKETKVITASHEYDYDLFRSVIFLTTYSGARDNSTDFLNAKLTERQYQINGTSLEKGVKPLDLFGIRENYNSVQFFASLANESQYLPENRHATSPNVVCEGRALIQRMTQRVFTFPSGTFNVQADGSRDADLLLSTFNTTEHQMQVSAHYVPSTKQFVWETPAGPNGIWVARVRDVPICGFAGTEGPCEVKSKWALSTLLPVLLVTAFVVIAVVGATIVQNSTYFRMQSLTELGYAIVAFAILLSKGPDAVFALSCAGPRGCRVCPKYVPCGFPCKADNECGNSDMCCGSPICGSGSRCVKPVYLNNGRKRRDAADILVANI
ncbi:hypothetical protein BV898_12154 [Hypsibius exemplaris]|uniref:Receptor ligand binding region domain-containing protein n=1 Tax=Hypsibius exemplaris TaxID=2072580 RepID=A0A1W0WEH3_HYPEX|nr:hypothetical protein BV898_12154 [Hypsibius exemplaris]